MSFVVGIGHYSRVGKDALGEILVREHGFTRLSFADPVRTVAYDTSWEIRSLVDRMGWDRAKVVHPSVRRFLVNLGASARRNLGDDVWVRALERQLEPGRRYVITDLRYPNEAEWVLERGIAVKLTRPGVVPGRDVADSALATFDRWTCHVQNDGDLNDLKEKAALLVGQWESHRQRTMSR